MNIDIKLHKNDLPDDIKLGNVIAVDGEFMGLNVRRDPLCLVQISTGNSDAHIIQLDRSKYNAPNLVKVLADNSVTKIFHYGRADIA
jgi:ribonuclease D